MKIIRPSVEYLGTVPTDYNSALQFIERAGRTCYRSEDKITPDSAEAFVRRLIRAGHLAMVEHSNFVIKCYMPNLVYDKGCCGKYLTVINENDTVFIGGNLTAWFNAAIFDGPSSVFEPFCGVYGELFGHNLETGITGFSRWQVCPHNEIPRELHRFSALFTCDRGVSHELVRHRPCSFAQESTRYVNYGGKDMEFIEPWWWETERSNYLKDVFVGSCEISERNYGDFIAYGRSPQAARAVLPNALATRIVVTADAAEWRHIRALRTASTAHPDIQRVMNMMPWEAIVDGN